MITEDYCSFEIAKFLKEKGFDEYCLGMWHLHNGKKIFEVHYELLNYNELRDGIFLAPTHQMAMKWLREKGILVLPDVRTADGMWFCMIVKRFEGVDNGCTGERRAMGYYDAYEEAVEAALKYSLENLIQ